MSTSHELFRCLLATLMGVTVSGCGGGGESADTPDPVTTTQSQTTTTTPPVEVAYFEGVPLQLEDPYNIISQICNETGYWPDPSLFTIIPTNINNDGDTDFILHYWCQSQYETRVTETPNVLVAQVSDGYGGWHIDNLRVFDELYPSLGGASRKWTVGDFNNDGHDDYAFSVNWEDYRTNDSFGSRWDTEQTVLLSKGNGEFSIERVGLPIMGHAVTARPNELGYDDLLISGFISYTENKFFQAYRFVDNVWEETTHHYPDEAQYYWAIDMQVVDQNNLISGYCDDVGNCGIGLYTDTQTGWQVSSEHLFDVQFAIQVDYGDEIGYMNVYDVNGQHVMGLGTDEMCLMEYFTDAGTQAIAVEIWGDQLDPDLNLIEGQLYSRDQLVNFRDLMVFEIVDGVLVNVTPETRAPDYRSFYMECKDLNNDGFTDIFFAKQNTEFETDPIVYLNYDGDVRLFEVQDEDTFPDNSVHKKYELREGVSRLIDVNQDNLPDLITYGYNTQDNSSVEVYLAQKELHNDN